MKKLPCDKARDNCLVEVSILTDNFTIPPINLLSKAKSNLKLLEEVKLGATSGTKTIYTAKETFKSYIDNDFKNWGLDKKSIPTKKTDLSIYELKEDSTFKEMFTVDLENLVMTQSQIIDFCKKHRSHLRQDGYATFFLTKKDFEKPATEDNLFVVHVRVDSDGLRVSVFHFDGAGVWGAVVRPRVVVPKLS